MYRRIMGLVVSKGPPLQRAIYSPVYSAEDLTDVYISAPELSRSRFVARLRECRRCALVPPITRPCRPLVRNEGATPIYVADAR